MHNLHSSLYINPHTISDLPPLFRTSPFNPSSLYAGHPAIFPMLTPTTITMKAVPRAIERWLHQHNLQGMLRVHQVLPFDDLSAALSCPGIDIVPEWIRATLDLPNTESLAEEAPTIEILVEYFGPYSPTVKGFRTSGGPNKLFNDLAYFLSKVAFVAPSPHIMHRTRAGFIITAWKGIAID